MNTISHGIFSTNLLTHKDIRENRLTWLNNFCKPIAQQVNPPPFSKTSNYADSSRRMERPSGGRDP